MKNVKLIVLMAFFSVILTACATTIEKEKTEVGNFTEAEETTFEEKEQAEKSIIDKLYSPKEDTETYVETIYSILDTEEVNSILSDAEKAQTDTEKDAIRERMKSFIASKSKEGILEYHCWDSDEYSVTLEFKGGARVKVNLWAAPDEFSGSTLAGSTSSAKKNNAAEPTTYISEAAKNSDVLIISGKPADEEEAKLDCSGKKTDTKTICTSLKETYEATENAGKIDIIYGASPEDFAKIKDYGLVIVVAHGVEDRRTDGNAYTAIKTGVESNLTNIINYSNDIVDGRINIEWFGTLQITDKYFQNLLEDNSLNGTSVLFTSCNSAKNDSLKNVFLNKGVDAFLGFSDNVYSLYGNKIMESILSSWGNGLSIEEAIKKAQSDIGESDKAYAEKLDAEFDKDYEATLKYYGNRLNVTVCESPIITVTGTVINNFNNVEEEYYKLQKENESKGLNFAIHDPGIVFETPVNGITEAELWANPDVVSWRDAGKTLTLKGNIGLLEDTSEFTSDGVQIVWHVNGPYYQH